MKATKETKFQHLTKAPITEALIEIRIPQLIKHNDNSSELKYFEAIKNEYPIKHDRIYFDNLIKISKDGTLPTVKQTQSSNGNNYLNKSKNQVIQMTTSSFIFSRLTPYKDWEYLINQFNKQWVTFQEIYNFNKVTRVGVRFINQMIFPAPLNWTEYFRLAIPIQSDYCDITLSKSSSQFLLNCPDSGLNSIINLLVMADNIPNKKPTIKVVFDIDVFTENNIDYTQKKFEELFEKLRFFKNSIFFSNITDKTVELYK